MTEPLLSPADVSAILGIPTATLANWRWRSVGPKPIKVGRHVRYRRSDIERWLDVQADSVSRG